jgi:tripartite-type tricarboxylate transporter receptor subunit TctC
MACRTFQVWPPPGRHPASPCKRPNRTRVLAVGPRLSRRRLLSGIGTGALSLTLAAASSKEGRAADFYQGKTLTLIVGFAPGGGVDTTSRLIARHLVRFIPGQPGVVVQNMEGAAGVIAANFLDRRIAPDGLTLAVPGRSWFVEGIVKSPGVTFDPTKLTWIGSAGAVNSMMFVRSGTGIKSFDELKASQKTLTFGSLGSTTPTGMVPTMLAAHGVPIKVIFGYVSTARVLLALEQGEVDGVFTVEDAFSRRQDLIKNKVVIPILQNKPTLPGIPQLREVLPKSEEALLTMVMSLENFGLPLVGPAGIPAEQTEIMRKAFVEMCKDPDYQAEAAKVDQPIGAPIDGAQLKTMIDDLAVTATPAIVAAYKRLGAAK